MSTWIIILFYYILIVREVIAEMLSTITITITFAYTELSNRLPVTSVYRLLFTGYNSLNLSNKKKK